MASKRTWRWLAIPAILLFFYLALDSMTGDSATMDEQNHIARGLAYLRTGDPRLSVEHPPLINALSALPLLTMPEIELPLDDASWQRRPPDVFWYIFAEEFLWGVNRDLDVQKILNYQDNICNNASALSRHSLYSYSGSASKVIALPT